MVRFIKHAHRYFSVIECLRNGAFREICDEKKEGTTCSLSLLDSFFEILKKNV